MTDPTAPCLELVALRLLPTAVRGRCALEGPLTYRKSLEDVIPGQLLSIREHRRWRFRKTLMVGGPLVHVGFSLRALREAGFRLPALEGEDGIDDPAGGDLRLSRACAALVVEDWLTARCELLDVLQEEPGSIGAHCGMGLVAAVLRRTVTSLAHYTAAVRLGFAALGGATRTVNPSAPGGSALLGALSGRSRVLEELGRPEAAASDLRRALRCDPSDQVGAGARLARLSANSS